MLRLEIGDFDKHAVAQFAVEVRGRDDPDAQLDIQGVNASSYLGASLYRIVISRTTHQQCVINCKFQRGGPGMSCTEYGVDVRNIRVIKNNVSPASRDYVLECRVAPGDRCCLKLRSRECLQNTRTD